MAAHDRWSYKTVKLNPGFFGFDAAAVQAELDKNGAQGWELVNSVVLPPRAMLLIFKRLG